MIRMKEKNIVQVLDCTLRDGGQGLEAINNIGEETEKFSNKDKDYIISNLTDANIDIIEIGCMSYNSANQGGYAIYKDIIELSKSMPKNKNKNVLYTGLYIDPDTPIDTIPRASDDLVPAIRVIMRYSQLQKSIDFCSALAEKGYKVFIQPMLTMRYTDDELNKMVLAANEMGAYALYIVDSFGYMMVEDIKRIYDIYCRDLDKKIKIGFHAHNNMDLAFLNAQFFVSQLKGRDKIIDSCVFGMGQGAGNLQTELILSYLNSKYGSKYGLENILDVCEIIDKFRSEDQKTWGYTPLRLIPALYKTAYKYAVVLKSKYEMSYREINNLLKNMPNEYRHRYTQENLEKLINGNHKTPERNEY